MGNVWLKIKVWTKVVLFVLVLIWVFSFLLINSGQAVKTLWVFPRTQYQDISVLVLIFLAFAVGVIGTLLVGTGIRTTRQIRDLREKSRQQRFEREMADMKAKAAKLQTRPENEEPPEKPNP